MGGCRSGTPVGCPGAWLSPARVGGKQGPSGGAGPAWAAVLRARGAAPGDGAPCLRRHWRGTSVAPAPGLPGAKGGCPRPAPRRQCSRRRARGRAAAGREKPELHRLLPPVPSHPIPFRPVPSRWDAGAEGPRRGGRPRERGPEEGGGVPSQRGAGTLAWPLRGCRPGKTMTWRQRLARGHGPPRERRAAWAVLGQAAAAGGAGGPGASPACTGDASCLVHGPWRKHVGLAVPITAPCRGVASAGWHQMQQWGLGDHPLRCWGDWGN